MAMNFKMAPRSPALFYEARRSMEQCLDALVDGEPLSAQEFSSASFLFHDLLDTLQEAEVIADYDQDALFKLLSDRHEMYISADLLQSAMHFNDGDTDWTQYPDNQPCWSKQLRNTTVVCGIVEETFDQRPIFSVYAIAIAAQEDYPWLADRLAPLTLEGFQHFHLSRGVYLGKGETKEEAMKTVCRFKAGQWHYQR